MNAQLNLKEAGLNWLPIVAEQVQLLSFGVVQGRRALQSRGAEGEDREGAPRQIRNEALNFRRPGPLQAFRNSKT
jgi:hypothetical protein